MRGPTACNWCLPPCNTAYTWYLTRKHTPTRWATSRLHVLHILHTTTFCTVCSVNKLHPLCWSPLPVCQGCPGHSRKWQHSKRQSSNQRLAPLSTERIITLYANIALLMSSVCTAFAQTCMVAQTMCVSWLPANAPAHHHRTTRVALMIPPLCLIYVSATPSVLPSSCQVPRMIQHYEARPQTTLLVTEVSQPCGAAAVQGLGECHCVHTQAGATTSSCVCV